MGSLETADFGRRDMGQTNLMQVFQNAGEAREREIACLQRTEDDLTHFLAVHHSWEEGYSFATEKLQETKDLQFAMNLWDSSGFCASREEETDSLPQTFWLNESGDTTGYTILPDGHFLFGEWKNGKYRGERLTFTSERVYGIDISKYQHGKGEVYYPINWRNLRITYLGRRNQKNAKGKVDYPVSFVFIKSSEGTSVLNPHYHEDYRQARAHGIRVGSYHYFSAFTPAEEQARHFLANTRFSPGDLPPVLDVEPTDWHVATMGGAEAMLQGIREWLSIVERKTGVRPILYLNLRFVRKYLPLAPDLQRDYLVWLARYVDCRPDVNMLIWQLCPDGRVSGIRGPVDINVFSGYADYYGAFLETLK